MIPVIHHRAVPSPAPPPPKVSAKIVLLVDSHEDSRTIYTAILEHHGFAVVATSCGDEGLRLSRERART